VLLIGVAGALVMRGIFIALGATLIANFAITFLFFGLILLATAVHVWREAASDGRTPIGMSRTCPSSVRSGGCSPSRTGIAAPA
jgi:Membrane protein TerC, possibly involved in tellurium resistance